MKNQTIELATLAGGCFWCLEAVYEQIKGVEQVVNGYSGGHVPNPSYQQVCSETSGHAEVVQVTFDSQVLSYREILKIFFAIHDPTTLNRQGYDVGTSYRSAIYYHDSFQQSAAQEIISELDGLGLWADRIVTEVEPLKEFYRAEDYHQQYYLRNEFQPYCQVVISPKLSKFRKENLDKLKSTIPS